MSDLTPVSFKKGRASLPRLSPPRVPGTHHPRFWTEKEKDVVRRLYPAGGAVACEPHLPRHSRTSIYQRARLLGLRVEGSNKDRKIHARISAPADIDDRLRDAWPGLEGRGAVRALADRLGLPRWWVSKRAAKLGLAMPQRKEPPWTAAETALLGQVPLHDLDRCARIFREHGFRRTAVAIQVRATRMRISRRYGETLSARAAAEIIGLDNKTVTLLCISGELKAGRRGTERLPQQGGDAWAIRPEDLRAYVTEHLNRIDIRKVEKFAFVDLLTGGEVSRAG